MPNTSIIDSVKERIREGLADAIYPKYRDEGIVNNSSKLWKKNNASNEQIHKAYGLNGFLRKLIDKKTNDMFDNWFKVVSENEQIIEDVNKVFSAAEVSFVRDKEPRLDAKRNFKSWYKQASLYGFGFMFLEFEDDAPLDEPVVNPSALNAIRPISVFDVKKVELNMDITSPQYGNVELVKIKSGKKGQTLEIHGSRLFLLTLNSTDQNWKGAGYVRPAWNYLTVLENVIWSVGQSFYRYAGGFPHIKVKGLKKDQAKELKKQWADVNSLNGWVSKDDVDIKFVGADGKALSPEHYFNIAITAVASSFDIPAQIVIGTAAGALTRSETNLKDYYSDISSQQDIEITPFINTLILILQSTGQVSKGEFQTPWNPLFEVTEKEIAETQKVRSETIKNLVSAGIPVENLLKEFNVQQIVGGDQKSDQREISAPERNFGFTGRTNIKAREILAIEKRFQKALTSLFTVDEYMDAIKDANIVGTLVDARNFTDDFVDLKEDLEKIRDAKTVPLNEAVNTNMDIAWEYGKEKSDDWLNMNIIASRQANQISNMLKESTITILNSLNEDVTKKVLFTVQEGVLAGEGIVPIRNRVNQIVDSTKKQAELIARTESHRAEVESIKQAYRDSEIVKEVEYITARDAAVRPSHAALDGKTFPLNETPSELQDPNCRCTVVAIRRNQ